MQILQNSYHKEEGTGGAYANASPEKSVIVFSGSYQNCQKKGFE
jgi:hypothetical protein